MKRCYTTILCLLMAGVGCLNAQIKGDFENWVEDTKGNGALPGQFLRPGTQPEGWEASNVNQKVFTSVRQIMVTSDAGRASDSCARMENKFVGVMGIGRGAPAYITLGVPWTYAVFNLLEGDGGTIGGIPYTGRPDSIVGYFKRSLGNNKPEEKALILAYLWEGTAISSVPVNPTGDFTSTETAEVHDQERLVLTSSNGATLIGKAEYQIDGELGEWKRIAIPFEYYNNSTPEKLNVIISSSNYYDRDAIGEGNILWADDVELVFKSTTGITEINEGVTLYTQPGKLYVSSDKPGNLVIYTLQGSTCFQKNIAAGQTSISLPKGFYIVKINDKARKVVIN